MIQIPKPTDFSGLEFLVFWYEQHVEEDVYGASVE